MDEDCENCAFWRDHYYWEHMGDEKKQFSAVAKGDFKNNINLPLRLVSHFKEETCSAVIKLEAPDGNIYNVRASKHSEDQVVLQFDWDAFVAANHIQKNDLLIFHSKGKIHLKVLALDPSGCDKNSSCFDMKIFSKTGEGSVRITDARPCTVETIDLTSSDDDHTEREDAGRSPGSSHAKARKMASASSPSTKSGSDTHKLNLPISSNDNLQGPSRRPYILARGITLSGCVEKKVQEKVQAIGSKLPIYVAVMTKSCVGGNLFSLEFCTEYGSTLPSRDQTLMLQLEDQEWHTTVRVKGRKKIIYRGWSKFASDNNLKLGDVCLFKMAERSTRSLAMRVHFIRKSGVFL